MAIEETAAVPTVAPVASAPMSGNAAPRRSDAGGRRGSFATRKKVCRFCVDRVLDIDFKQTQALPAFVTEGGKVLSGRTTGNCARHQRQLGRAIKRARFLALLPYSSY